MNYNRIEAQKAIITYLVINNDKDLPLALFAAQLVADSNAFGPATRAMQDITGASFPNREQVLVELEVLGLLPKLGPNTLEDARMAMKCYVNGTMSFAQAVMKTQLDDYRVKQAAAMLSLPPAVTKDVTPFDGAAVMDYHHVRGTDAPSQAVNDFYGNKFGGPEM